MRPPSPDDGENKPETGRNKKVYDHDYHFREQKRSAV